MKKFDEVKTEDIMEYIKDGTDDRIFAIAELIRRKVDLGLIYDITKIDMFFLQKIKNIIKMEKQLLENLGNIEILKDAKKMGFSDKYIAKLWNKTEEEMYVLRKEELKIMKEY